MEKFPKINQNEFEQFLEDYYEKFEHILFSNKNLKSKEVKNFLMQSVWGIYFLKNYYKEITKKNTIKLPPLENGKQKTLFLDLDETLVHISNNPNDKCERYLINTQNRVTFLNIRPYVKTFLKNISKSYEVFIFTAGKQNYAESVVKVLDPKNDYINGILHRFHCIETNNGKKIKELIKNRRIQDLILVDNLTYSFGKSMENGIPIIDFIDDSEDKELIYLEEILTIAKSYEDVREFIKNRFDITNSIEKLINK